MEPTSAAYYDDAGPHHGSHGGPDANRRPLSVLRLMAPSQQQASLPMALVAGTGRLPEDQRIFHHCDGNLNFSTAHNDDDEFGHRKKQSRDPLSHRVIEKRRRDRMNNCLADLSRLIPADYIKRGRGRVEKTEIIEMAIKHMQYLQTRVDLVVQHNGDPAQPALGLAGDLRVAKCEQSPCSDRGDSVSFQSLPETAPPALEGIPQAVARPIVNIEHYRFGYEECATVAIDFLVEREGLQHNEGLCSRLSKHLEKHREKLVSGDSINFPRSRQPGEATSSSGSSSSCGGGATSGSGAAADPQTQTQVQASASQLRDRLSCASPPLDHRGQHYECPSCVDPEAPDAHGVQEGLEIEHEGPEGGRHSFPDSTQNSYKFKTCINKRFSEEHNNGSLPKRRRSSPQSPLATPSTPSQPSSQQTLSPSASVPVFVWHTKGAFYIPLTMTHEALAPFLDVDLLSDTSSSGRGSAHAMTQMGVASAGVALHSVTISVNYQQYWKPSLSQLPHQSHQPAPPTTHPVKPHEPVPPPLATPDGALWGAARGGERYLPSWEQAPARP